MPNETELWSLRFARRCTFYWLYSLPCLASPPSYVAFLESLSIDNPCTKILVSGSVSRGTQMSPFLKTKSDTGVVGNGTH